jgi:hypothetical protein
MIEVRPRYMSDDVTYEVQSWKHAMPNGATPPVFTATHAAGLNLRWIARRTFWKSNIATR